MLPVTPPPARPLRRRRLLLAAAAVLALALAVRALPAWRARSLPTGKAEWIWEARGSRQLTPGLFYAVRDFDLLAPPRSALLAVGADPEYVLSLNGKRIGAGGYRPDAGLDVYEVGPLLLPGGNRLIAELRSDRGAGGFLASLTDGSSGAAIVQTDARFRVFHRHDLGLLRGWLPIDGSAAAVQGSESGEPARSWGLPPIGRWGRPRFGRRLPVFAPDTPILPAATSEPAPLHLLYDWGREVTGRLELDLVPLPEPVPEPPAGPPPAGEATEALLYAGDAPPDPRREPPAASILLPPDGHVWLDAWPRRFRYALIVGLPAPLAVRLRPVAPGTPGIAAADLARTASWGKGVLGIVPPPLRTPVEDEVGRKLERLAGVAGRKEL